MKRKENLIFFIKLLLLVIFFAFLYGLGQKYQNWPVITTQNSEYAKGVALRYRPGGHLASTFAGHYDMAAYIVLTTPIFYVLLLSSKSTLKQLNLSKNSFISRSILFIVITMSLWLLVNAASRISMVSYLGSATLALLLTKKYKFIPLMVIFTIAFTSMSSNLIDRYMNIFKVAGKSLISVSVPEAWAQETVRVDSKQLEPSSVPVSVFEDRSTNIRLRVEWPRAIRAFRKNPLFGTGYSSITLATDNGYLRMLGEIGVLGFAAFTILILRITKKLFSSINFTKNSTVYNLYVIAIFSAIPGIMLNMVFIDILEASKLATTFWLLIGFAIGLGIYHKNEI